jgi:competence protein ComEC
VVDRFDLWRRGAHAIYLDGGDGIRVETVRDWRGERPWTGGPPLDRPKVSDNDE